MEEVTLRIRDKQFKVKKQTLCQHSDYFRAMFSGSYVEEQQKQISIDVLDPDTMVIILQYMNIGLIDLSEYPLSTIGDIAITANFLQITELTKQIEYTLDMHLCESNWMEIMTIAEDSNYLKLERFSAAFGLYSFKSMKPKQIPTIHKLAWYLSHPYLDTRNELEVFECGYQWILNNDMDADALLIILGCLDLRKITHGEIEKIKSYMGEFENSLACKVIECLFELSSNQLELSETVVSDKKIELYEKFTERVVIEVLNIVRESKIRLIKYTPVVHMCVMKDSKPELLPHFMYTFDGNGFEQWLEVGEKNLWGWCVASWGLTRLVVVCGEYGRGTGVFMKDVKVYDTLRKEWTRHGVELPRRRHAGVAVIGDLLYLVGGVGGFRVVLETAVVYDLKQRTHRKIAKLPDTIQNPAVCSHDNKLYVAGERNIYLYNNQEINDYWEQVVGTNMRMSCIRSFKGYIYCIQNYFSQLYRFRPGVNEKLQQICCFSRTPATLCDVGDRLIVFTRTACGPPDTLVVEDYRQEGDDEKPKVIFEKENTSLRLNDRAGSCVLVLTLPPLCSELSQYQKKYLTRYT